MLASVDMAGAFVETVTVGVKSYNILSCWQKPRGVSRECFMPPEYPAEG